MPGRIVLYGATGYIGGLTARAMVARGIRPVLAGRDQGRLTAVNAAEVCDQMVRVFGSDPDALEADLALLAHVGMALVPVTPEMAIEAGRIRARRYDRKQAAVSVADCIAAAAALAARQPLATADPALANVVRAEGGEIHRLSDSKGWRP